MTAALPPPPHPSPDELEVSVFGRGVGEAIAMHVGGGAWITVDSCLDDNRQPASLAYLEGIGVDVRRDVRVVAVSHWDRDHVEGIDVLFSACERATFVCAPTLSNPEIVRKLRRRGNPHAGPTGKRSVDRFATIFQELDERGVGIAFGQRGTVVWETPDVRVWTLSPSGGVQSETMVRLLENTTRTGEPRRERRNPLSMVIWIEAGDGRVLLGGDLERTPGDAWGAVAESPGRRGDRATVFKVPHHGSEDAHADVTWEELCVPSPWAAITRFTSSDLPTDADRDRIRSLTSNGYLAGAATEEIERDPMTREQVKANTASEGTEPLAGPVGHIRMRAPIHRPFEWDVPEAPNVERV